MKAASLIVLFAAACVVTTAAGGKDPSYCREMILKALLQTTRSDVEASPQGFANVDLTGMPEVRQHENLN